MSAEDSYRQAFARLKAGQPKVLPAGTPVSQNNVAKEAGADPSALRKSRYPKLVQDIQDFVKGQDGTRKPSERQRLLKLRRRSRSTQETIIDLKQQRDSAASVLLDATAHIVALTQKVRDLESRLETSSQSAEIRQHRSRSLPLPRAMDIDAKK